MDENKEEGKNLVEEKVKLEINEWLEHEEFLAGVEFSNKYYFYTLVKAISNFIKNIPIPVITSFDNKHNSIYFMVGKNNKKFFPLDSNIAYPDFITMVDQWTQQFYPQYEYVYSEEIALNDSDTWDKIQKEKIEVDDAMSMTHKIKKIRKGIIYRIFMLKDEFIFTVDDKTYLRRTGTALKNLLPLSVFLKEIRKLKDPCVIENYIYENSDIVLNITDDNAKKITNISYSGEMMLNFFKINYTLLKKYKLKKLEDRKWEWGKYIIIFESNILEKDCLDFVKKNEK